MTQPAPDTPFDVDAVLAAMTVDEKIALCAGRNFWNTQPVPRLGVPAVMMTDGPHGLRKQRGESHHGVQLSGNIPATCFPTASALAASWDPSLVEEVGTAIGEEALAEGVSVVLGPGTNLKRTPLCGRNFEYFSEDPLVSSAMAAAWIRGVQKTGVGASLKHFAANSQEHRRYTIDARIDERALRELYLACFEQAVVQARPWTVMTSYNRLDGTYCSEHPWLLTTLLRGEWGFQGVVVSDWGAVNDRPAGLRAGCDLEMPGFGGKTDGLLRQALAEGRLSVEDLDRAARRLLVLVKQAVLARKSGARYDVQAHHALARKAAVAGTVLLKNDGALLPLRPQLHLAVIGAMAVDPRYQGAGSSSMTPSRLDNALDALRARVIAAQGTITYAPGYPRHNGHVPDEELLAEAVTAARAADAVVVFAGLTEELEAEGLDRAHLRLPAAHDALVSAVAGANPRVVVVLSNGAPVDLPWADQVPAILEAYLGGQAGGSAVAQVLLGEAEPEGRLAESFPMRWEDNPVAAMPVGPRLLEYRESLYVGYRYYDSVNAPVRFPFGHGLGYTTFEYSGLAASPSGVAVTVTNTGARAGAEVVQVYVHALGGAVFRPEQELKAFAKVRLAPGESRRVELPFDRRTFAFWDVASGGWAVDGGRFEIRVGRSSRDVRVRAAVEVPADEGFVAARPPAPEAYLHPERGFDPASFAALYAKPLPPNASEPPGHFTVNTPLSDMRSSAIARMVHAIIHQQAKAYLKDDHGPLSLLVESMVEHMSLRELVMMTSGDVQRPMLDGLAQLTNGRYVHGTRAILRALRAARPPPPVD